MVVKLTHWRLVLTANYTSSSFNFLWNVDFPKQYLTSVQIFPGSLNSILTLIFPKNQGLLFRARL